MKKVSYFLIAFLASSLLVVGYNLFVIEKPATPNHATLPLTPFTAREQQDLIASQEQKEGSLDVVGPLVAKMSATEAQTKVLNLMPTAKPTSAAH